MQTPKLFAKLPEYAVTPDGMAIADNGDLIVACPNFADTSRQGCLIRFDVQKNVRKWVDVPVRSDTGISCPMGIAFGPQGDIYICDNQGDLYIADFSANAIAKVTPDAKVVRIAQSPDTDGFNGELDQPGEPIVWQGRLVVSCFDLVTGPDKVNTRHELPATMSELELL